MLKWLSLSFLSVDIQHNQCPFFNRRVYRDVKRYVTYNLCAVTKVRQRDIRLLNAVGVCLNPFRTAVPFWGHTSQISSILSPKRDCGPKGVNPPQRALERAERKEAVRGHSFRSYVKSRVLVSMQNPGPREPNRHERHLLHMPRKIGVDVHLRWCPSTSNNLVFVPVRSGRSVLPNKKKGCNTSSSSS